MSLPFKATFGLLLVPAAAWAQLTGGLSIGSGIGRLNASEWTRESRLSPTLRLTQPYAELRLDGTAAERGGLLSIDRSVAAGWMATPALGAFRLVVDGAYSRDRMINDSATGSVAPALSVRIGRAGGWLGSTHEVKSRPGLNAGAWVSVRSAVLSLSSRTLNAPGGINTFASIVWDSIPNDTTGGWNRYTRTRVDTVHAKRSLRWSQLEARLDWSRGRLALSGLLATGRAEPERRDSSVSGVAAWGRINAAYMLNQRLSLIAGAGSHPVTRGRVGGSRFATFGLRFSPAMLLRDPLPGAVRPTASSFALQQIEPGLYKIVLRVPSARTVELSGEFNRWIAVAMTQTRPDVWEVTLPIQPGIHRLNVRVDGDAWTAPPGLPAVDDEFNGRVGILVVR